MCLCAPTSACMCKREMGGGRGCGGCGGWLSLIIKGKTRIYWIPVGAGRPVHGCVCRIQKCGKQPLLPQRSEIIQGQLSGKTAKIRFFSVLDMALTMMFGTLTQCRCSSVCTGVVSEAQAQSWGSGFPAWATETWSETWDFSFSQLGTHLEIIKSPQNKHRQYRKPQAKPQIYELCLLTAGNSC